jgi:hypothetical protein
MPSTSSVLTLEVRAHLRAAALHAAVVIAWATNVAIAKVNKLRDNTNNIAIALENEAAESLRRELQRRHTHVERLSTKVFVPDGAKLYELDAVVIADSCAAVAASNTTEPATAAHRKTAKGAWLRCATQLPMTPQWWSWRATQKPHSAQCEARCGRQT